MSPTVRRLLEAMSRACMAEAIDPRSPDRAEVVTLMAELTLRAQGKLDLSYDVEHDTLNVAGITYSMDLFRTFGGPAPVGALIEIIARDGGVITVKQHSETPEQAYKRGLTEGLATERPCIDCSGDLTSGDGGAP